MLFPLLVPILLLFGPKLGRSFLYHKCPNLSYNRPQSYDDTDLPRAGGEGRDSSLLLTKRSQLNGYPKPRKLHKKPHWSSIFEEDVEKEPLGTPCKLLAKDVIENKRRLRLTVKKTKQQMYATIFDDVTHNTLCFMATNFKFLAPLLGTVPTKNSKIMRNKGGNVRAAYELGKLIGRQALSRGISHVHFDRKNYRFHGRVEALAIGARKVGLIF